LISFLRFHSIPRRTAWIIALVFTALSVRLALFVDGYAINLLYLDEWDYLHGLFEGADAWTLFRWQHGLHRQGVGNLILAVVLDGTGWNSRAVAAASAAVMALAGLAGMWLVRRICGRLRLWDVTVPLLFLTTTSVENYIITPNLAHGPLPALFLIGYALSLTVSSHPARGTLLVAINFLAVNTGFTVLLGGLTPIVFFAFACQPGLRARDRTVYGGALIVSLATAAHFARGLVWVPAVPCYVFPHDPVSEYVTFAGRLLARPFNLSIQASSGESLGIVVAVPAVAFTLYALFRALRSRGSSVLWNVTGFLAAFTIVFAFVTAVGRVCTGLVIADSSRYIPYVLPGLLGVYLVLRCGLRPGRTQVLALGLFVLIAALKEVSPRSGLEARAESGLKRAWHDCYLRVHDIAICNASAGRPAYPAPEATNLQQKLDWLEARRYNLFQDR
jgi:hypothetical protein